MEHHHCNNPEKERGPFGCAGQVKWIEVCNCGAERKVCSCHQCRVQGTSKTPWQMPICTACKKRHPLDQCCN